MSNFDSDGSTGNEWDERGDLAWNEFDWERYLREQDETVVRYLRFYEACRGDPNRIDAVAEKMSWGQPDWDGEGDEPDENDASGENGSGDGDDDVYTVHQNPIFIATKAIYLGLSRSWQSVAADPAKVPQTVAVAVLAALQAGEEQAVQAIHALDYGDYAMAVSLFKRALGALNGSLALVNGEMVLRHRHALAWREMALPQFFDLREIWLRVMSECREELDRPIDDEG